VHTSTVTVAVTDVEQTSEFIIDNNDIEIQWFSGSGNGGQNKNKHDNSCRLIHLPTNIVKTAQSRDRKSSYKNAYDALIEQLKEKYINSSLHAVNSIRKLQIGSGMRADKVRTFRFQDDSVVDHRTNKKVRCKDIMKGNFDLLW
jgi:peptide chain release factor 1